MKQKQTVILGVTGSIAAYKSAELARLLHKEGVRVIPVLTPSARQFVGPSTFSGLLGEQVHGDMFAQEPSGGEKHIELAKSADLLLIAPATADIMSRLAAGRADDLLTAIALSFDKEVLLAPAMHPNMWHHPATTRNRALLLESGRIQFVGPVRGWVASGDHGDGRFEEPETIAKVVMDRLAFGTDFTGMRVVVTAGPTVEDIDPVRFLGNRSSGKMGFALAERAARRGAAVTLISGPVSLPSPKGVIRVDVRSALEMQSALQEALNDDLTGADALIMAAAVADHRPKAASSRKIKRGPDSMTIELLPNPDLLAEIGLKRSGPRPILVGFAVETASSAELVSYARAKLLAKRVDLIVANHGDDAFGRDDNRAVLVSRDDHVSQGVLDKRDLADLILNHVKLRLASQSVNQ